MEPQRKALEKARKRAAKQKKNVPRRLIKLFAVLTGSLLLLIALLLGAVALILTPSRLTPLVNEYSSRYLDAQVRFDTVTLSVFENFPNVSVKLSGGEIISHAFAGLPDSLRTRIPAADDTLLKFDEFSVSLNLPQLLASAHFDPPDRPDAAESLCLRLPVGQSQLGNLRGGHDGRRLHGAGRRPIPEHRRPGHSQQRTNRVRQQARQAVRYGRPGAPAA